jgi:hypothetical protein
MKKASVAMLAAGSAMMGLGLTNQLKAPPAAPTHQLALNTASPALPQFGPDVQSRETVARSERSFRAEYTGSFSTVLKGTTKDGHMVSGRFTLLWEKDLFTMSQMDKEVQLKMLLQEMSPSLVKPEWTGETPSSYGPDIVEAYQRELFKEQIEPMLQERFAQMTPQMPAEFIRVSPTALLVGFEINAHNNLRDRINTLGLTPTMMSFDNLILHMPAGETVLSTKKVVTESYEVTPPQLSPDAPPAPPQAPSFGNVPL